MVGIILAQYGLWQAIIRLPLGIAADWAGRRKPFVLVGLALVGVSAWVTGQAEGVGGLFVGRALAGLGAGTWVPLIVGFSSLFPAAQAIRATAILAFVGSAGRVLATSLTGSLNELGGYSLAFSLAAGVSALALLLMLPIRERSYAPRRPSVAGLGHLITRRDVLLPSLLAALGQYANWAITFGFMPIVARNLGASDIQLSLLVSMHIGLVTVMTLATGPLAERLGARRLALVAFVLLSAGIALASLAPALPVLFVAQFCIGVATGLSYPVLMGMSIRYVADRERTTAMGLHQAVYAIGMFAGPWISGILADRLGLQPMLAVTAVGCLVLSLLLLRLVPGPREG